MTRRVAAAAVLLSTGLVVLATGGLDLAKTPPTRPNPFPPVKQPALPGLYLGRTSQGHYLHVVVGPDRASVVELRFAIAYQCADRRRLALRALVLRAAHPWQIGDTGGRGFSDWFSGPIGHDFHITGTLSTSRRTLTGTLHSLLLDSPHGRCDSGPMRFAASFARSRVALPAGGSITLSQYQRVPNGLSIAEVETRLGPPADRERFQPAGVIAVDQPTGVPGAYEGCLGYLERDYPHRPFSLCFHASRLISRYQG